MEPGEGSEPVSIDQVSLPEARPIPDAVRASAGEVLDGHDDRIRHADRAQLSGPRPSAHRPPRTSSRRGRCGRRMPPAWRRFSTPARRRASPWSRSAVGRASWEGWRRSPMGTRGRLARALAPAVGASSTPSRSPRAGAGPDGARGRGGARRPRRDPGALPAVLRGGHDRGLRRHPLRRPGLERLRPLRRRRHLHRARRAGRAAAHPRDPSYGGGAIAARARPGLGGHPRRDHRRELPGAPGAASARLRGLDRRGLPRRAGDRPRPRPAA